MTGNLLVEVPGGAVRGMRFAEFATEDLTRVGAVALPGLTVGENRVALNGDNLGSCCGKAVRPLLKSCAIHRGKPAH